MNTKVYVLIGGCIDDKHVLGVFSSVKKIEQARKTLIKLDKYYQEFPDDLEIETFCLNGENINA